MSMPKVEEGKISFPYAGETYQTWYKLVGELQAAHPPLIVLHGGPGVSHDYLLPLENLVSLDATRAVIFYDQIGVGRSAHLPDKDSSFYNFELFIAELENLIRHFHLDGAYDLIGHSWGGILAAEFIARRQPRGLRHLVLTDSLSSFPIHRREVERLRKLLPQDVQDVMAKHEKNGTSNDPEYKEARMKFFAEFTCRIQPFPQLLIESLTKHEEGGHVVEAAMYGGDLKNWDIIDRLHLIHVPTLVINGEHDYMTDAVNWPFFDKIPRVKWVKFAQSSHMPFFEERERYMDVLNRFLRDGNVEA